MEEEASEASSAAITADEAGVMAIDKANSTIEQKEDADDKKVKREEGDDATAGPTTESSTEATAAKEPFVGDKAKTEKPVDPLEAALAV